MEDSSNTEEEQVCAVPQSDCEAGLNDGDADIAMFDWYDFGEQGLTERAGGMRRWNLHLKPVPPSRNAKVVTLNVHRGISLNLSSK